MTLRYFIDDGTGSRPSSARTLYVDGAWGDAFRPSDDLHLSHWIPNCTPDVFKANTSTGICLSFLAHGGDIGDFDLVVNDHADVDGMLAVFVLMFPELASMHGRLLVEAAEMGDFWGWGEARAQVLFQALTLCRDRLAAAGADAASIYRAGFECVQRVLAGDEAPEVREGLAALQASALLIETGAVERSVVNERLTLLVIPAHVSAGQIERCLHVPRFNAPLSDATLLLPQARARVDRERIQLVAVETKGGWFYDL